MYIHCLIITTSEGGDNFDTTAPISFPTHSLGSTWHKILILGTFFIYDGSRDTVKPAKPTLPSVRRTERRRLYANLLHRACGAGVGDERWGVRSRRVQLAAEPRNPQGDKVHARRSRPDKLRLSGLSVRSRRLSLFRVHAS